MPAGDFGKEQFRRAIVEFRNLHVVAALGPLFDFRSEVVSNDEFGVRGGLDETTKNHYVEHLLASDRMRRRVPEEDESWQVGLIVGPSGSGKSTVAKDFFGGELYQQTAWAKDKAVIDGFGDLPVRQVIELLTAVGFGSSPAWVKPYHVLSCGEQFRCDLARALAAADFGSLDSSSTSDESKQLPLIVFDEFTSVVDRQVAKACSTAIAKGIRKGSLPCRFIAVTCHYDVAEWLEADWVLDMATGSLQRRRLRRPEIKLEIYRCRMAAWKLFARHHYLTGVLPLGSRCFLALWEGEPVAFCATMPVLLKKGHRRFCRIVTLPDYQGMGIGMRFMESSKRQENRFEATSHPGHQAIP